jgi:anti-sigma regulatory factor (Ser/Thr protein kinase)
MKFIRKFGIADENLFRTELIIGELLANTVEHAPRLVKVEVDWRAANPVLTILDAGPGLLRFMPSLPSDSLREGGRGLFLVGTMSGDVRVAAMPGGGTKMTVVLPARRELTPSQASPLVKSG